MTPGGSVVELRAENRALRAVATKLERRCEELETEADRLRDMLGVDLVPPGFGGLTPCECSIFGALIGRDFVPREMSPSIKVLISNIRRKLAGVIAPDAIRAIVGKGYSMSELDRRAVRDLLKAHPKASVTDDAARVFPTNIHDPQISAQSACIAGVPRKMGICRCP